MKIKLDICLNSITDLDDIIEKIERVRSNHPDWSLDVRIKVNGNEWEMINENYIEGKVTRDFRKA